ncbi:potassium-transporting ATPase subunit F [Arthrobacter sulfonylureivorans]|uniref:Potassium-transporting ATPase subunit F n=1 Tax=Arthrobacter sulfonylureivorans TaxID=2486855 RepID=A0ABY3W9Y1_9MICC|nr:potassium-transporting ATPase subunit F [Arthrobacter sulfonylureivorans]UNK47145.1 potassium-transporting ATPase subunit F [Arthrobacter sulfonylureivorans]
MNADAIMWTVLLIAGLSLLGYLLAVLIHPEKW